MRDELLNEILFLSLHHARVEIAARVRGYNQERPHSSLGYETPAAFAAELHKQWPVSLCPTGSAPQTIASIALMRKKADPLYTQLVETRGSTYLTSFTKSERTSVVSGKSVTVRVTRGGGRKTQKKKQTKKH